MECLHSGLCFFIILEKCVSTFIWRALRHRAESEVRNGERCDTELEASYCLNQKGASFKERIIRYMSDYITTYSGIHFYPLQPEADKIYIEDIAHALSLICRGNGHVKHFFSVGQHCINCAMEAEARGYSRRVRLACLLHDASEAYLSDVPGPFKKSMPAYRELEQRMLDIIYGKYLGSPLTEAEAVLVKVIDEDMLYFDLRELLSESSDREEPEMKSRFSEGFVPFDEVERQYLGIFRKLNE